jgi:hypothetical protein
VDREWDVDGYLVVGPIVQADGVELWWARERSTGLALALRRLPRAAYDPAAVRRLVGRLSDVPHVLPVRGVVEGPDDVALVHDLPAGGTLAGLLNARTQLPAGEVVTIGVPLAQSLRAAHERGCVHGGIAAAFVVFDGDGRPALLWPGAGLGAGAGARAGDGAADDVRDLRILLASLLDANAATALHGALQADGDADQLAHDLLDACPAAPVRLRRPLNRTTSSAKRTSVRRPVRRLATAVTAALALGVAVAAGLVWAKSGGGHSPTVDAVAISAAQPTKPPTDWRAVIQELDVRRDSAFVRGDVAMLRAVYASPSKALAVDEAALRALTAGDLRARGLRLDLVSVTVVSATADRASLHVVDRLPAYDLVDARGHVAAHRPSRGLRDWRIDVARVGESWLIASVRAG